MAISEHTSTPSGLACEPISSSADDHLEATLRLTRPLHFGQTLGPMQRGLRDPCIQIRDREVLRVTRNPAGPASLCLRLTDPDTVRAWAWGPGAAWQLACLPDLLGEHDDPDPLNALVDVSVGPEKQLLHDLIRRFPGLRIPRSRSVLEALVPSIVEQRVTGKEAWRSYGDLVRRLGEPALGPADLFGRLRVPPTPAAIAGEPYWELHRLGIELKRAQTLHRAAQRATRLETAVDLPAAQARELLTAIPGIGPWTAGEVALVALGDPDAVSVGDYHIPHQVTYAFTGRHRGSNELLLELLEPYRGQRGRVIRLIQAAGVMAPRHGPRAPIVSFRTW